MNLVAKEREHMEKPTFLERWLFPLKRTMYRKWLLRKMDDEIDEAMKKTIDGANPEEVDKAFKPAWDSIEEVKKYTKN